MNAASTSANASKGVLFEVAKQLEHGTPNPIVARLNVQPISILNQCKIATGNEEKFVKLSTAELSTRLLRCGEIEQRLRKEAESRRKEFKPPDRGDAAVTIPQIANLTGECEDFLYQAKNYLRDLLKLFNLLWGTDYEDAPEWAVGKKKDRLSVRDFIVGMFGKDHANAAFISQYNACIEPFVLMRNAVEHPNSSKLIIKNFTRDGSKLNEPTWAIEKNGKVIYGPFSIIEDMAVAIGNLLIWAEDMLIMWALENLVAPQLVEIRFFPEEQRDSRCPIKYCIRPTEAALSVIAKTKALADKSHKRPGQ